jgi:hypothetical protein
VLVQGRAGPVPAPAPPSPPPQPTSQNVTEFAAPKLNLLQPFYSHVILHRVAAQAVSGRVGRPGCQRPVRTGGCNCSVLWLWHRVRPGEQGGRDGACALCIEHCILPSNRFCLPCGRCCGAPFPAARIRPGQTPSIMFYKQHAHAIRNAVDRRVALSAASHRWRATCALLCPFLCPAHPPRPLRRWWATRRPGTWACLWAYCYCS